jgi:hypothetical protein
MLIPESTDLSDLYDALDTTIPWDVLPFHPDRPPVPTD